MDPAPRPQADARIELGELARALRGAVRRRQRSGARHELQAPAVRASNAPSPQPAVVRSAPASMASAASRSEAAGRRETALSAGSMRAASSAPAPIAAGAAGHARPEASSSGSGPRPVELAPAAAGLEELRALVAACTACELCHTRRNTVFSDGPPRARLLFVGEAPGESEDEQGVPFVGRAGALLTDIIVKGMGLARSEVAIANVLKCRPPGNRDPSPQEKELCSPFLDRQIELIDPELIVALGRHAAQHLLGVESSMGALRGRVHARGARKVVATYHPAYLLRNPAAKKDCWQDIQLALRELGLPLPAREARQ